MNRPCFYRAPATATRHALQACLAALSLTAAAHANDPAKATADQAEVPAAATAAPTLYADVQLSGFELEPELVRQALAKELEVALAPDAEHAAITLRVQADLGKEVTVTYLPAQGAPVARSVRAPARADELPEVCALLAGNLARDDSAQLLADLAAARASSTPEAAVSPNPTAKPVATAPAKKPPAAPPKPKAVAALPALRDGLANLAFVHPISLLPDSPELRLNADLGLLYERVGGINGAAVNGLVLQVDRDATGALVSGVLTLHGGSLDGASVSGGVNLAWSPVIRGFQLGGLVAYASAREFTGVQLSGIASVETESMQGAQIGGLTSVSLVRSQGVQIAGWGNVAVAGSSGVQLSGLGNYASQADGAQLSAGVNLAPQDVEGFQLASVNVAGDVHGAQLSLVNIGAEVTGLQLGLVNVAQKVNGASVGLITYSKAGKTQLVSWASSTEPVHLGVRFYTGPLYSMASIGYDPTQPERAMPSLHFGGRLPLGRFYVDLDGQYSQHFENKFDPNLIRLRYRALGGFAVTPWLAVFAGGGVKHDLHTDTPFSDSWGPDMAAGIELF